MAKVQKLGPNQRKWLKALESGKFRQTRDGALKTASGNYCCLGVACEIFKAADTKIKLTGDRVRFDGEGAFAPRYVVDAVGFRSTGGAAETPEKEALYEMNDTGKRFKTIAKIVRANPAEYFTAPR